MAGTAPVNEIPHSPRLVDSFDCIVVGGGGSGLAAAVSAAEAGGRVLLLERQSNLGGTTGIAVGSFTAAGTRHQAMRNIRDSVAEHADDAGKFASLEFESRNNDRLRRFFLSHAAETLDWLTAHGVSFVGPSPEPPNRVPRMHNAVPNAKAYIMALQIALVRRGGSIKTGAMVCGLLMEQGRAVGVQVRLPGSTATVEYRASRGVILAAGDYASAPDLIRRFKGDGYDAIEGINPYSDGDGHRLVESVSGQLLNMDVTYGPELRLVAKAAGGFQSWLPASPWLAGVIAWAARWLPPVVTQAYVKRLLVTWQHPENALFDDGAILVNCRGQRFCNERRWPDRELAVAQQPAKIAFIVLDQRLCERYSKWPHFISMAPDIAYAYVNDYLRLRPDVSCQSNTLEELATRRGIEVAAMQQTTAAFNRCAGGQEEDNFGRTDDAHALQGTRWVLLGPVKAYFTTTEGGAAIDEQFRVLDTDGSPIPGLFAVGHTGLGGMILWGHGLHIAWAMTSGRLAGQRVMKRT